MNAQTVANMAPAVFDAYVAEVAAAERVTGLANLPRAKRERWCACPTSEDQESYYQAPDGRHGWFHDPLLGGCGAVTQTG